MTKQEYIERYGLEAYQRKLEQTKQWREQHREQIKEKCKEYNRKHRDYIKEYQKQYRKEYQKQYRKEYQKQINEYVKQWKRKNIRMFAFCVPEEWEQIENYELAKADNFDGWCIHHRLETHNSDGERRLVSISRAELIALDMYYNRPANELIFLTISEHGKLHHSKVK